MEKIKILYIIEPVIDIEVILTGGQASKQSGSTNTIRLETIK